MPLPPCPTLSLSPGVEAREGVTRRQEHCAKSFVDPHNQDALPRILQAEAGKSICRLQLGSIILLLIAEEGRMLCVGSMNSTCAVRCTED